MNVGRRSDGVASARVALGLLEFVRNQGGEVEIAVAVDNIGRLFRASRSKSLNTLHLLADIELLHVHSGIASAIPYEWEGDPADLIATRLVEHLLSKHIPENFGKIIQIEASDGPLWIDSLRFPGRNLGIPHLLHELGVCVREQLSSRHWQIVPAYKHRFLNAAKNQNLNLLQDKTFSASDLKDRRGVQEERGKAAEEWVVEFERGRLAGHTFLDQVRRISEQHVAAGFDVLSFENLSSLSHNWFVEVKSYEGQPSFFWTRNEVERAMVLGDSYVLYLVDRSQMSSKDYEPTTIAGPYKHFFDSGLRGWRIVANEYWISLTA